MDLIEFLLENGPKDVDAPIFVDVEKPGRAISWREYASSIKRLAVGLRELGLKDGDSVALLSSGDITYYVLGDGVVAAGGVFSPMAPYGKRDETAQKMKSAGASWVFASPEYLEDATAAAQSVGIPASQVLLFDGRSPVPGSNHGTFSSLLHSDESLWEGHNSHESSDDRPCYRLLTSGSTGPPKGVELTHEVMIARCQSMLNDKSETRLRTLHCLDFHHVSGNVACNSAVLGLHTLYCSRQEDAVSVIENISKFSIGKISIYPKLMLDMITAIQTGVRGAEDLASLRYLNCGGSSVPAWSLKTMRDFLPDCMKPMSLYGSTEAFCVTAIPPGVAPIPGYVGCYSPEMEVTIIDPETLEDVGPDVDGEVCCRNPWVFKGYFNNEAATNAAFVENSRGKWHRTGDKGRFVSSVNQLAITGRYKDVFVVGTEKVSPDQVEAVLVQHDGIADAGVTSTPDQEHDGLYKPIAYVVAPDSSLTAQDVVDFAAERLSSSKVPTGGVVFCDRIPRTDVLQKVMRRALDNIDGQPRSAMNLTAAR